MKFILIILLASGYVFAGGNSVGSRTVNPNDLAKLRTEVPDLNMKAVYLSHVKTGGDTVAFQKIDLATQKVEVVEKNYYELDAATKNAAELSEHIGLAVEIK